MANKAYKFRLYPTQEQAQLLTKTFGCVRFVYNKMLAERKETYEQFKGDKEALKKQKFPTPAKYKEEFAWLKEVDSLALANAQLNLQKAYENFFFGRAEFPNFKNRKARQSYTTNVVNGNIMLLDGYIKLPKLKLVKMKQHREIPSFHIIKSCTVSRTKTGKYYVSILTEYEHHPVQKEVQAIVGRRIIVETIRGSVNGTLRSVKPDHITLEEKEIPIFVRMQQIVWFTPEK